MRICLEEVKRCQEVTPRPNFIILLGDRYGWRPLPAEIPADEWEKIEERLPSQGEEGARSLERLREWYERDLNARPKRDPPRVWLLKPRTETPYTSAKVWESEVERPLREILTRATSGLYGASATEQEIDRGALGVEDAPEHVLCFFRRINGLPEDARADGFRDLVPAGAEPERLVPDREAGELLEKMKSSSGRASISTSRLI